MTKQVEIELVKSWSAEGRARSTKKATEFKVYTEAKVGGLPKLMTLAQAREMVRLLGGEIVPGPREVSPWDAIKAELQELRGDKNRDRERELELSEAYNHAIANAVDGFKSVHWVMRLDSKPLAIAKLTDKPVGLKLSNASRKRYIYRAYGDQYRFDESEHNSIQAGKRVLVPGGRHLDAGHFVEFVPHTKEGLGEGRTYTKKP